MTHLPNRSLLTDEQLKAATVVQIIGTLARYLIVKGEEAQYQAAQLQSSPFHIEAKSVWRIISALRGPDHHGEYGEKENYTCPIRSWFFQQGGSSVPYRDERLSILEFDLYHPAEPPPTPDGDGFDRNAHYFSHINMARTSIGFAKGQEAGTPKPAE